MKKLILAIVLLLPSLAFATSITTTGSADCDGWMANVDFVYSYLATVADMSYTATLYDAGGAQVAQATGGGHYVYDAGTGNDYDFSGSWNMDLCGDYTVHFAAHAIFYADDGSIFREADASWDAAFTCDCPPPPPPPGGCFLTPGYWKNHVEAWGASSLMVGGNLLDTDTLLMILNSSVQGDATVILAHHLIAAKLNVLAGADPSIQSTIDAADAYLMDHPIFSDPSNAEGRQYALSLKDDLADYNQQGCPGEDDGSLTSGSMMLDKSGVETTTLGSLKALYK